MSDIKLDAITGDLVLENFDLALVSGDEEVAQSLRTRLQFFLAEWFLDRTFGVPYYQQIFQKPAQPDILDATLKDAIIETPGVNALTFFDLNLESDRTLTVQFRVTTDLGELEFEEELAA